MPTPDKKQIETLQTLESIRMQDVEEGDMIISEIGFTNLMNKINEIIEEINSIPKEYTQRLQEDSISTTKLGGLITENE